MQLIGIFALNLNGVIPGGTAFRNLYKLRRGTILATKMYSATRELPSSRRILHLPYLSSRRIANHFRRSSSSLLKNLVFPAFGGEFQVLAAL